VHDAAVRAYLDDLADRSAALLDDELLGVYAAGSIALDSYDPGRSDIDVAVVCANAVARPIKRALIEVLRHESLPCPARGLELVLYRAAVAAAGTPDPGFELELNSGPRMTFRATFDPADRPAADGAFWYAIDRSILAERGRAIVGPPAPDVFRSVALADLIDLLIASLRWHLGPALEADPGDLGDDSGPTEPPAWTDDAVLNACRGWQRVRTGHWSSKLDAPAELLITDGDAEHAAVVRQAVAARAGGPPPGERQARAFQRTVLHALEEMRT
jgi:hypothetical protein